MKIYDVCIDLRNEEHVRWWNIVNLFVKAVDRADIVEKATGETVACIFKITGLFAKNIASKNVSFIKNPVTMKF